MKSEQSGPQTPGGEAPRYVRIQRILQDRIAQGRYAVGSLMPTEIELSEEFATSRFTIRSALRNLMQDGYVERRQGMGTRVLTANPTTGYYQSFESLQELFQIAVETYLVVLGSEDVVLDAEIAKRIGGDDGPVRAGERWILFESVRWTAPGGRPLSFIQSYVPERFRDHTSAFADHNGPFFDLLETRSQETIIEAQQEIRAMPMPQHVARAIGLREGALSLQLTRRYLTARGILIASVNWHPADKMIYRTRVRRRQSRD
ncbi:GntR family transcriptional regulator [Oceaniglobus roseus]|uniref:GntR family transcriptional regulator n=1 Tax=Oceaniglobus roseus TaxID=1737570 RepID=UPI001FE688C0|nr:GntR family transcriptional regulator [Kandeliimicrobium roseum]